MTDLNWPRSGFETLTTHVSGFVHLNINLGSAEACRRYHDIWMGRYRRKMSEWDEFETLAWSIRMRQSLKLTYSSTYFALSSEHARAERSLASAYFFAYYAAVHAMWSVLHLHPDETHRSICDVTHSKLANVFRSEFARGNGSVLNMDAGEFVENLRFLREYYSDRMPLNFPFNDSGSLQKAHIGLGGFVKQSIQLANLHSHFIHKAAEREHVMSASVPPARAEEVRNLYHSICSKSHPSLPVCRLDPADEFDLSRLINVGCDLLPHSVMNEHMFDEYMAYADDHRPPEKMVSRVRELVYKAF